MCINLTQPISHVVISVRALFLQGTFFVPDVEKLLFPGLKPAAGASGPGIAIKANSFIFIPS